jgi:hypothetical protein
MEIQRVGIMIKGRFEAVQVLPFADQYQHVSFLQGLIGLRDDNLSFPPLDNPVDRDNADAISVANIQGL